MKIKKEKPNGIQEQIQTSWPGQIVSWSETF